MKTLNRLTRLGFMGWDKFKKRRYQYKCTCGNTIIIPQERAVSGMTKSCGCLKLESIKIVNFKHGDARKGLEAAEHRSWRGMLDRCNRKSNYGYKYYGGRGISVCKRWGNSYKNFLNDMGRKPSNSHTLDRIDANGNYVPSNCRWATRSEQGWNRNPSDRSKIIVSQETRLKMSLARKKWWAIKPEGPLG